MTRKRTVQQREPELDRNGALGDTTVRFALFVAALCAARVVGPRGPVYWDSFGYVSDAISSHLSGLGLGRPWFSWIGSKVLHVAVAAGASLWSAESILRMFWTAFTSLAAPATHALARRCGLTPRASLFAALAVAFSPAFAHTSHQVLSDGPAVAATLLALVAASHAIDASHARAASLAGFAGGALLAFATGLREQSLFFAVTFVWIVVLVPASRRIALAGAMTAGFALTAAITVRLALRLEPDWFAHIGAWREAMRHERSLHHHGVRDLAMYLAWVFSLGPATVIAAAFAWTRDRALREVRGSLLAAVCIPSLAQLALLATYQDIAYSPRYLLPALAGAIAIPAARWCDRVLGDRPTRDVSIALALVVIPAAIAAPLLRAREAPLRAVLDATPALLANLPDDALVVTGQACGQVMLTRRIVMKTSMRTLRWRSVCPGWSWPDDLATYLERDRWAAQTSRAEVRLHTPRVVAVDLRRDGWIGAGQGGRYETAAAWVRARADAVARGEVVVWR